ncbi:filamin-A-like protein 2 [Sarcoptes scabiei]|uniref:Filamin-A-like protein 2 n=1 Tax=Sarcoptes scabiei TaxID=52283 RepID=A0A132AEJ4_SARSC|nr:filamin-A-like protein 2 [Sarcoptes scabiei]
MQEELPAILKKIGQDVYELEFKPLSVGTYTVFLNINDQPVKGSPFFWNVFDANQVKVFLPKNESLTNNEIQFEIDTTQAGSGSPQVLINQGQIPVTLKPLSKTRYLCTFKAKSSKNFVDIKFNGQNVPNSPFCLKTDHYMNHQQVHQVPHSHLSPQYPHKEIINGNYTIKINAIENFKVETKSSFSIDTEGATIDQKDLQISITDPFDDPIEYRILEDSNNSYRIFFSGKNVGIYNFKILYKNSPIKFFQAKAYDIRKILIGEIPKKIILGQQCSLQVDASKAGEGQLEIAVNDGDVPNHVQVLGNGKCMITFKPELPIHHMVDIKFNNENIIGCPFVCEVEEFPDLKFDLSQIELVQILQPVRFNIESIYPLEKSNFSVKITSPSNKIVPGTLNFGPIMIYEFIPLEVGPHSINFEFCSKLVFDQPHIIKCFDPSKVIVTAPINGYVGKPVQFIVDAISAGEGNLEISVITDDKNVPTQVQPIAGAKFGVSFTPAIVNDHIVSVTFNNVAVNDNPFLVNIFPATDKPIITGPALYFSPVDQTARLTIFNIESENDIIAKVQDGNNQVLSANIIKDFQNHCIHLEFLPKTPGEYKVQLKYRGSHIQGSPFMTKIYDINKIRVKDIPEEICLGKMVTFLVEATNAGPGNLEVIVNNGKVPSTPKSLGSSLYAISFLPTDPELHVIEIKFNGKNVENSPFNCRIRDAEKVMFRPLEKVSISKVSQISVDTKGGLLNENSIIILSPTHQSLKPILLGDHLNGYDIQFCPNEVGDHAIDIKIGGNSIPGCPFLVKVYDATKVKVTDIKKGIVGKPIYFTIDASNAGAGNLEIIVSSNGRNVPNYVQSEGNARFRVNFKPTESTIHLISCKFNGEPVPGSPFSVHILQNNNQHGALVTDTSIKNISLNKETEFQIENPNNEYKQCQIFFTTPTKKTLNPTIEKLSGYYKVRFKPNEIGPHQLNVMLDGTPLNGSPFISNVYDVEKIKIGQLRKGFAGKPYTFLVDASQAGEGTLELIISTKTDSVKAEVLMESRGLYSVTFLPQECSTHYLNMSFNDEDVPGSPFNIEIVELSSEDINHTITGRVNQPKVINFRASSSSNLKSNIEGPNKTKIDGSLAKIDDSNYKLEFLPRSIGRYRVDIFENEKNLWSNPLLVQIVDPSLVDVKFADCQQNKTCCFSVDTAKAGEGELSIRINAGGKEVPLQTEDLSSHLKKFKFLPKSIDDHFVEIAYNNYSVMGSPFQIKVEPSIEAIVIYGEGLKSAQCNRKTVFFIESEEPASSFDIIITDPNHSPLPVKCYQQKSNRLLVEWIPNRIGPHSIEVFHQDKLVGSPFTCEAFDASNIKIESIESSNFVINKKINLSRKYQILIMKSYSSN